MDPAAVRVLYYQTASGRCPFRDWLYSLDGATQAIVDDRLTRVCRGLFGHFEYLGEGVYELKLHRGPGYRIYYGKDGRHVVLLLQGGGKKGQATDISEARVHWKDYLRRTRR